MSTLQEIEDAIERLSETEFAVLFSHLRAKHAELWDREMQRDAQPGGALDLLAAEAVAEYRAGKTIRLP